MDSRFNPFVPLYITERIQPADYVKVFSPLLVPRALSLFQPGNVVLLGTKGCGKTMLLNLLRTSIRIAYLQSDEEFPVTGTYGRFISAGVNLTDGNSADFGQLYDTRNSGDPPERFALEFADYLNYYITRDLLATLAEFRDSEVGRREVESWGLSLDGQRLSHFAKIASSSTAWMGALANVESLADFSRALDNRIQMYNRYTQVIGEELPSDVRRSVTRIGVPIAATIDALHEAEVLPTTVPVFVRLDNYEDIEEVAGDPEVARLLRRIVNKGLSRRDPQLSYKIGSRKYGWNRDLSIFRSKGLIEEQRHYNMVDIDEVMRRQENARTYIFPTFAEEVFRKRLSFANFALPVDEERAIRSFFGPKPDPAAVARSYAGTKSPERILNLEESWPDAWKKFLLTLVRENPLSAKLGEAWLRQKRGRVWLRKEPTSLAPWEAKRVDWWRYERTHQALLQIAARSQQKLRWYGDHAVDQLSAGNILTFMRICKEVWDAWLQHRQRFNDDRDGRLIIPHVGPLEQSVGIDFASRIAFDQIAVHPNGHDHQRFIYALGQTFRRKLREDDRMAYPGWNGFSLTVEELNRDNAVRNFLQEAVDFGDITTAKHTTKEKDNQPRRKWYLAPILSPLFQLPARHKKEPYYASIEEVRSWMSGVVHRTRRTHQLDLF